MHEIDPVDHHALLVLGFGLVGFWLMWEGLPFAWGVLFWLARRFKRG